MDSTDYGLMIFLRVMLGVCAAFVLAIYVTGWTGERADALFGVCLSYLVLFALVSFRPAR